MDGNTLFPHLFFVPRDMLSLSSRKTVFSAAPFA